MGYGCSRVISSVGSWRMGGCGCELVAPLNLVFIQGVEANLAEWSSQADEEAFRNL
jgi:hypothetical protein